MITVCHTRETETQSHLPVSRTQTEKKHAEETIQTALNFSILDMLGLSASVCAQHHTWTDGGHEMATKSKKHRVTLDSQTKCQPKEHWELVPVVEGEHLLTTSRFSE